MTGTQKEQSASKVDAMFLSTNGEKTFEFEDGLPNLPIPPLKATLARYLDSVKPHLTPSEFQNTSAIVDNFENGIGKTLHEKLLSFAKDKKNWIEEMWEDGYLNIRAPINLITMCGILMIEDSYWPLEKGTGLTRGAFITHKYLEMFKLLQTEKAKPQKYGKINFSMYQWRRVYNTCRIPGDPKDSLFTAFKTESEGSTPRNLLVLMNGHIFTFDAVDDDGRVLTVAELESQFRNIQEQCVKLPPGPGLAALTVDDRPTWAKNREYLIKLDANNKRLLRTIEHGLFCVNFDKNAPTKQQVLHNTVFGDCQNRWYDKSANVNVFTNGAVTSSADHMPADGMVMVNVMQYAHGRIMETTDNVKLDNTYEIRPLTRPQRLEFKIDSNIEKAIKKAVDGHKQLAASIDFCTQVFTDFGKGFMKQQKMHPDTFIQLVIQLAYYRMHNKLAPTYETATTRQYYHGRTETLRSSTVQVADWIQAMEDKNVSNNEKISLMKKAYEKHNKLMADGIKAEGCDRHLLGLYQMAKMDGLDIPKIYSDPAWTKSGGDGNFVLSTSLSGYSHLGGGTIPMCNDGYGLFYSIMEDKISFCISAHNSNTETDAAKYFEIICQTLQDVNQLLATSN